MIDKCQDCPKTMCEVYLKLAILRNAFELADASFFEPDKDGRIKAAWEIDHEFRVAVRAILAGK